MNGITPIIPGGKLAPSTLPRDVDIRLKKTEEEMERLRTELEIKERKLRGGLKTWSKLERESAREGLKSDLSDQQVRMMAGEGVGGAAF